MDRPYIERMRAVSCGCVKDVTLALTPLHALIGPNDSGKSTLLSALKAGVSNHPWPWQGQVTIELSGFHFARTYGPLGGGFHNKGSKWSSAHSMAPNPSQVTEFGKHALSSRLLRLDPDAMRRSTDLIPHTVPKAFDERGEGLPAVYDAILSEDRTAFIEIERQFVSLFPTVRSLLLENTGQRQKALGVMLTDGTKVFAPGMSEGMLYWLAMAALPHLAPTSIVFIEEPENGLHPSRIAEVMRVLRELSEKTQIVLATHSPLVINELQPEEVTIITRTATDGTIATPMTKTKHFEQRSKVYALGELWLSFADGNLESELTGTDPVPTKSAV